MALRRKIPDPLKAHGAMVYLGISILAGSLTGVRGGFLAALLAGLGFAGVFLMTSAAAVSEGRVLRLLLGGLLASSVGLAITLGADPSFLGFALVAIPPAALSGFFAFRLGFQSPAALGFAVTALAVAAPSCACAGGADPHEAWLLLGLLAPFFAWRTWVIRRALADRRDPVNLRRQGWREVLYALVWTLAVVATVHLVA